MISDWISAILLILGACFMLVAGIGVLRFSDVYLRMHAATKAPSLGVMLMVVGIMVHFQDFWIIVKGLLIIVFIFMTTPVGAHMLSRVAHLMSNRQCNETIADELSEWDEKTNPKKKKTES
jgi:multicomponent Na+:H+ antiporter subunit G